MIQADTENLSIEQLEQILEAKQQRRQELEQKREELAGELQRSPPPTRSGQTLSLLCRPRPGTYWLWLTARR